LITLDIDGKKIGRKKAALKALRAYTRMKDHEPNRRIQIWLSSSRKGFHLIREGNDFSLSIELALRELYEDDPERIKIDRFKQKIRSRNSNVLWNFKDGKRAVRIPLWLLVKFALVEPRR
jgi:hypothetical protein